jgi:asterless protein
LDNIRQDLADANQTIENLNAKLNLQNFRDTEIEKLKTKAMEFENFMKISSNNNANSVSSPTSSSSNTKSDSTPEVSSTEKNKIKSNNNYVINPKCETEIRDEMAKIFANQIKNLENHFKDELKKFQNEVVHLTNEMEKSTAKLQVANEQLDILKFTIVSERQHFQNILKQKEDDFQEHIEKYNAQISDLNDKMELIDEERLSIDNLRKQIDEERMALALREEETMKKLKQLEQESTKIIEQLNEKYQIAKKTANNYKKVHYNSIL